MCSFPDIEYAVIAQANYDDLILPENWRPNRITQATMENAGPHKQHFIRNQQFDLSHDDIWTKHSV